MRKKWKEESWLLANMTGRTVVYNKYRDAPDISQSFPCYIVSLLVTDVVLKTKMKV